MEGPLGNLLRSMNQIVQEDYSDEFYDNASVWDHLGNQPIVIQQEVLTSIYLIAKSFYIILFAKWETVCLQSKMCWLGRR